MIGLAAGTRIWIVAGATDMRRGFVGLSGMVQTALRKVRLYVSETDMWRPLAEIR
jgi:hypothetical protein